MDIYAGKDCIVICRDNVRGGYDRVEGSIGRSYDEMADHRQLWALTSVVRWRFSARYAEDVP